ncbi:MAG: hypothetical protein JO170_16750 [Verrucomicrobia bacterium]|nr:hypothetical protein [Verrucomicrobiota bacterium]
MPLNPFATFDCLYFGSWLQQQISGFSAAELHLLSYLACLLGLYRAQPQTDWGYAFVGTELGAPFSAEIEAALQSLERWGYFTSKPDRLQMTAAAQEKLEALLEQFLYRERIECLKAAASSILAFSVGTVREALGQQPDLRRAKNVPGSRALMEEAALDELYRDFDVLRRALQNTGTDLRLPAVLWITALFKGIPEEGAAQT